MFTQTMKKGDTRKSIVIEGYMPDGGPVDFTGAEVRFLMMKGQTVLIDREAYIEDAEGGILAHHFEDGDTDSAGIFKAWFKVTYNDGSRETFPDSGCIIINIE